MIAKCIVLSDIISVVSGNILIICIQEPLLLLKKFIFLFHTLSAYNSLLFRYKVYLSDQREWLYTSWRDGEAYENFSIDPAPCWKNPIKKVKLSTYKSWVINYLLNVSPSLLISFSETTANLLLSEQLERN